MTIDELIERLKALPKDVRRRTVDGPRDVGLTPDRAAELFFRDIMASIEQGKDR